MNLLPIALGSLKQAVDETMVRLRQKQIIERIWGRDHTVWKPDPTEIANRMAWLDSPTTMPDHLCQIKAVAESIRRVDYTHALLLGMGGSSLAPEVFSRTFGTAEGGLVLSVLDSTDPDAVRTQAEHLAPARTLFIPATKSGGTVETMSFLKYFYNRAIEAVGYDQAGEHFVAITDPGSSLADLATELNFRHTFLNHPEIGGRYSALSFFGLVPAVLIGMDVELLLQRARDMAAECARSEENSGAWLGAILGAGALGGRDKITLVCSPPLAAFGAWVEQLIAESTGKEGKGILPVEGEPLGPPSVYAADRLFVYLRLQGDDTHDHSIQALIDAGQPAVCLELNDRYDLGGEFMRWEMATIVAAYCLEINPFDQPNVEAAKLLARDMIDAYREQSQLPALEPTFQSGEISVYSDGAVGSLKEALEDLLERAAEDDDCSYIALQAYVDPNPQTDAALQDLRLVLRNRTRLATTLGYGPRFLHSTGQLHKGDAGHGLFIQFTSEAGEDVEIPATAGVSASSFSFGVLKAAQALGDRQGLIDNQRQVLRIHLGQEVESGLKKLIQELTH